MSSPLFLTYFSLQVTKIFGFPPSLHDPEAGSGIPLVSTSALDAHIQPCPLWVVTLWGWDCAFPWTGDGDLLNHWWMPPGIALHGARHTVGTLGVWIEKQEGNKKAQPLGLSGPPIMGTSCFLAWLGSCNCGYWRLAQTFLSYLLNK